MPRIVVLCVALSAAACVFNADYGGGHYLCSDGACPSGQVCVVGECKPTTTSDARDDSRDDGMATQALDCAAPGSLTSGTPPRARPSDARTT
jgi:hypothetical protein